MKTIVYILLSCIAFVPHYVYSFCGFYVAKADTELFNEKSEVILTRDGFETVLTMSNDFKGDVKDFAMVIPVPTVLSRNNIKVVDPKPQNPIYLKIILSKYLYHLFFF